MDDLRRYIREIPDFPKPGILFYDITPLLQDPRGLRLVTERLCALYPREHIDKVVGIESRGFLFGPLVAHALGAGFVPVRKPGKLPFRTRERNYALEYGTDRLAIHVDGVHAGERTLIVDDLVATGGTARAASELVEESGGELVGLAFVIELAGLNGRATLGPRRVESILRY